MQTLACVQTSLPWFSSKKFKFGRFAVFYRSNLVKILHDNKLKKAFLVEPISFSLDNLTLFGRSN